MICYSRGAMAVPVIHGQTAPGFERAKAAFEANFKQRGELGASFCVMLDGEPVVNLWAGLADKAQKTPWQEDTLAVMFSATKGLAATCCLMLGERGQLDYDALVSKYWPAFGTGGRAEITVRQLLNHQSGLVGLDQPLDLADLEAWDPVVAAMEAQEPHWPPGTGQGYHGVTFGLYVAELFRRVAGESLGTFLRREVAVPLGADVHLGLPTEHEGRVATLYPVTMGQRLTKALPYVMTHDGPERRLLKAMLKKDSFTHKAFAVPAELGAMGLQNFNLPRVWRMELPWVNALGTARGLATVYSALACGGTLGNVTLCSPQTIAPVRKRQSFVEMDRVICKPVGWSQGFIKEEPHLFSPELESFGHPGMGGALGFCDPTRRLSWAYLCNRLDFRLRSPRALALSHAVYDCLEDA